MKLYIIEVVVAFLLIIIISIFLKIKNIKKWWLLSIPIIFLILSIVITFIIEKPNMNINNSQLSFEVNQKIEIEKPKTYYHFRDITDKVKIVENIDNKKTGKYNVKYEVPTILGNYMINQEVNIVDTIPPEIKLDGDTSYKQSYKTEYTEPGFTATDNYDGDLTEKVQITKEDIDENTYNLIYEVQDSSGNKSFTKRNIIVIDDVEPILKLNGQANMRVVLNSKYNEKGATATDEIDGDLTSKIDISGSVDTSKVGIYTITYNVKDNSGNEVTKARRVEVYEKTEPAKTGIDGKKGVIYLTFDDGPTTSITPKILNILKEKNVKATFFIINYNSETEKLVKREVTEGHSIGIHGYSHNYKTIYQSVETYMENITKLQEKIEKSTGYNTKITRFPGGSSNTVSRYNPGIMTKLSKEVVARGYKYFDWNVSSEDAGGAKTSQEVYRNVTTGLSKNRANVVLMHDFSGNTKTLNALADIIDYGINNGYTFEKITENTPMVTHGINN